MAKDDFKRRRRLVAAKHDPPLVHVSEVAKILGVSTDNARYHICKRGCESIACPNHLRVVDTMRLLPLRR